MTPDVSILIVNYNVKDYLIQCLRSIEASTGSVTFEVIVVDNASVDNSQVEVLPLFPSVRWIQMTENVGFGRANNVGLDHCSGRYVLFLNPDTIVAHETIATMVQFLDNHSDVGLAGCKVLNPDGSFQLACRRGLPTPWASFCKLFGLQSLFPKSRLFARYNLTYLPTDATYAVDALIGAFMIGPRELIRGIGGFDPAFFMYGEDIDLCRRISVAGHTVMYVHETSIIHFKGESTRRSSLNEVRVFYNAMEIFARKHFGSSRLFLLFLRVGIAVRSTLEHVVRRKTEVALFLLDVVFVLLALGVATSIRFSGPFGFPSYAYPLVLFVVPGIVMLSLIAVGEYIERRPSIRHTLVGLLAAFFVLSSLTYFFKDFAFSRGVMLMTIGFSAVLMSASRITAAILYHARGKGRAHNILVVGRTPESAAIIRSLQNVEHRNAVVVGIVSVDDFADLQFCGIPVIGTTTLMEKIIQDVGANEVILADPSMNRTDAMVLMQRCAPLRVRFHIATDYADIVTARILNDVAGIEPTVTQAPLQKLRNRFVKRLFDIGCALVMLPFLLLRISLVRNRVNKNWSAWVLVLTGKSSVVGIYPDTKQRSVVKTGIVSLAGLSGPERLDSQAIEQLNDYYVDFYSFSLDVDILLKHFLKNGRGKHSTRL